jgi:hypothetical protein
LNGTTSRKAEIGEGYNGLLQAGVASLAGDQHFNPPQKRLLRMLQRSSAPV